MPSRRSGRPARRPGQPAQSEGPPPAGPSGPLETGPRGSSSPANEHLRTLARVAAVIRSGNESLALKDVAGASTAVHNICSRARAAANTPFHFVGRRTAADLICLLGLASRLPFKPAATLDQGGWRHAELATLRKLLTTGLRAAAKCPPGCRLHDIRPRLHLLGTLVLRTGLLPCYARLLAEAAAELQRRPSHRNVQAAGEVLQQGNSMVRLLAELFGVHDEESDSAYEAHLFRFAVGLSFELQGSCYLECWAACVVEYFLAGGDDSRILHDFSKDAGMVWSRLEYFSGVQPPAPGPALGFLLSAQSVLLAAALDGGTLYGMPAEAAEALPLFGPGGECIRFRPGKGVVVGDGGGGGGVGVMNHGVNGRTELCTHLVFWALTLWYYDLTKHTTRTPQVHYAARRRRLRARIEACQRQAAAGGEGRGAEGCSAQSLQAELRSLAVLPYNTRALYDICIRLARAGLAALRADGGTQQSPVRQPPASHPGAQTAQSPHPQHGQQQKRRQQQQQQERQQQRPSFGPLTPVDLIQLAVHCARAAVPPKPKLAALVEWRDLLSQAVEAVEAHGPGVAAQAYRGGMTWLEDTRKAQEAAAEEVDFRQELKRALAAAAAARPAAPAPTHGSASAAQRGGPRPAPAAPVAQTASGLLAISPEPSALGGAP